MTAFYRLHRGDVFLKRGWLLDLYPNDKKEMVVWLKTDRGEAVRLTGQWLPSIYVQFHKTGAETLLKEVEGLVSSYSFCQRFAEPSDTEPTKVLELKAPHRNISRTAETIEEKLPYGACTIFNADISPAQQYLYEHNLFPLARVEVGEENGRLGWRVEDSVESTDYDTSFLKVAQLKVYSKGGRLRSFSEPIERFDLTSSGQEIKMNEGSEGEKITTLTEAVRTLDPDILLTEDGDSYTLPYIHHRAGANGLTENLVLGREAEPFTPSTRRGRSYFSYGRVLYRAPTHRLYGRVHLDGSNTFIHSQCGLEGLYEVARMCRMPLHDSARASIGRCMSSLQFYHAHQNNILVPWRTSRAEQFKDAYDLLVADRGGFIFEPRIGLHEDVGEIDFSSLYPSIMLKFNISGETVRCGCCPDSQVRVPELDYHICVKKQGIVPKTVDQLLRKRALYKQLRKDATDGDIRRRFDARQSALKWVLVTSFGYLGYRNAKFGRIDSHIAVCAFARKILLDTARIAEERGFRVIHGIVDSLWLQKKEAGEKEYTELCGEIERRLGFTVSFEGLYRWIAFLPSKTHGSTPVLNRYFGVFRDGEVKYRGIEARRRDTPRIVARCQTDILRTLAEAETLGDTYLQARRALETVVRYGGAVTQGYVSPGELLIERRISKNPAQYVNRTLQATAAEMLVKSGLELRPGQNIRLLITDADSKEAVPEELLTEGQRYDVAKYLSLLVSAAAMVLEPFGYRENQIASHLRSALKKRRYS